MTSPRLLTAIVTHPLRGIQGSVAEEWATQTRRTQAVPPKTLAHPSGEILEATQLRHQVIFGAFENAKLPRSGFWCASPRAPRVRGHFLSSIPASLGQLVAI